MGIFDFLTGKKNKCNNSVLRVHSYDLDNINDTYYYMGSLFTGVYYDNYPNGNVIYETESLYGKDHGVSIRFNGDATIHSVVNYSDDKIHVEDKYLDDEFMEYMRSEVHSQEVDEDVKKFYENGGEVRVPENWQNLSFEEKEKSYWILWRGYWKIKESLSEEELNRSQLVIEKMYKELEDLGLDPWGLNDLKNTLSKKIEERQTKYKRHDFNCRDIEFIELWDVIDSDYLKSIDFDNQHLEFYLFHELRYSGCVYQLKKSDLNTNHELITKWKDDYLRDGDFYNVEEEFDESNQVFEGNVSEQTLIKITSDNFPELFTMKITEFKNKYPKGDVDDFYEEIMGDNFTDSSEGLDHIMSFFNIIGDRIFYEDLIDDYQCIVCWVQYFQKDSYQFKIGYKEKG